MNGMMYHSLHQAVKAVYEDILTGGEEASPRGMKVLELSQPYTFTLTDTSHIFLQSPARKANYRFAFAEACWMLGGLDAVAPLAAHVKRMADFSDDGQRLWGAYGPRLVAQLPHVLASLTRDPFSRQAVVTTWRPQTPDAVQHDELSTRLWDGSSFRSKDVPCTVAWQFQARNGYLGLTVFMRSNDAWLGLPYDLFSFTTVQRVVASLLGLQPGPYHHVVGNLHLYEEHWKLAKQVLEEPELTLMDLIQMPDVPYFDSLSQVQTYFTSLLNGQTLTVPRSFMDTSFGRLFEAALNGDTQYLLFAAIQGATGRLAVR